MSANDAIHLLRTHDPARGLEPVPPDLRKKLRDDIVASAPRVVHRSRLGARRRTSLQLLAAAIAALVVGVGAAWAAGAISPLALFENNAQQNGAAPGSLWDQGVVPASVVEAATINVPEVGAVGFWYGTSKQGGWCGALRLPSGGWVGASQDPADAGGTVPGCFPSREMVNNSTTKPVYIINGFDYQEGDVDARSHDGSFWRIRYGEITIPGADRVTDMVSGRSARIIHGDLFALAIPDEHPMSTNKVHLVAYDADGKIVGDDCPACRP